MSASIFKKDGKTPLLMNQLLKKQTSTEILINKSIFLSNTRCKLYADTEAFYSKTSTELNNLSTIQSARLSNLHLWQDIISNQQIVLKPYKIEETEARNNIPDPECDSNNIFQQKKIKTISI